MNSALKLDMSGELNNAISLLDAVDLQDTGSVDLMDRKDTKYLLKAGALPSMLGELAAHYRILSINGGRVSRYASLYFDTDGFRFYREHHNGKMNRHKVRRRKYVESALHFVELKRKSNKGNTSKRRMEIEESRFSHNLLSREEETFVCERLGGNPGELKPVLFVEYSRLAFICRSLKERVTIDLDLAYSHGEKSRKAPGKIVVAEVKQNGLAEPSPFKRMMRDCRVRPVNFSKYCFGMNLLYPEVKQNRFKARNMAYNKLAFESPLRAD